MNSKFRITIIDSKFEEELYNFINAFPAFIGIAIFMTTSKLYPDIIFPYMYTFGILSILTVFVIKIYNNALLEVNSAGLVLQTKKEVNIILWENIHTINAYRQNNYWASPIIIKLHLDNEEKRIIVDGYLFEMPMHKYKNIELIAKKFGQIISFDC